MRNLKLPVFRINRPESFSGLTVDELVLSTRKIELSSDKSNEVLSTVDCDDEFVSLTSDVNYILPIITKGDYWCRYDKTGHAIGPVLGYPAWAGRMILVNEEEEANEKISILLTRLSSVATSRRRSHDYLETIFPVYECGRIYSDFRKGPDPLGVSFKVLRSKFLFSEKVVTGCVFTCAVEFKEKGSEFEALSFEINAFTPGYIVGVSVDQYTLFPPHIIVEEINVPKLIQFIKESILEFGINSRLDLLFQLSVFTDSFTSKNLLDGLPLGEANCQFEVAYFDVR